MRPEIKERVERIRKGEVPEGYKKTKVGILPEDWVLKKLSKITDVRDGTHESPEYVDEGIPFITSKNLLGNRIDWKTINYITKKDHLNFSKRSKVDDGDILFGMIGTIGNPTLVKKEFEFSIKNVALIKFGNSEINNIYLLNILKSNIINKQFHHQSNLAVQQFIALGTIRNLIIPICKTNEQNNITNILSTWDKAIELKEKLVEEKKEFKRGLMQKLLVGKLRFKEHVKNPNLQEVKRYGILPEEWCIKKASSIFSNISKKNNDNEQLLSATQNNGVIPRDMLDGDVMSPSGDTNSYKLVEEGDFVISLRSFQGGLEYSCYRGMVSPAYTVLKNQIPICKDFYRHLLKSKLFIDRLASSVIGIRDGKQISYENFSFMLLPYPELKEQEIIASLLNNIDNNIELLKSELNQLKEQKRGLMQLLLTGIVRVGVN